MSDSDVTSIAMINALRRLPPDTVLRCEGGFVGLWLPAPEDVQVASDGTKWVSLS